MNTKRWVAVGIAVAVEVIVTASPADAIPAFARRYKTACQTCHVMIPKLNTFGEAFRLHGYEIPDADELFVKDEPLVLGAEPWKREFPDAIWPSSIPGMPPVAIRFISDFQYTWSDGGIGGNSKTKSNFEFPHEFEVLTGGRLGEDLGFFGEVEWEQGGGAQVKQGYVFVSNPLGPLGVPDHLLNARIGLMDQQFFFAYNNTTRVGKNHPLWGNKKLGDWAIGGLTKSPNGFRLQNNQPGIELNGTVARRFFWGAGVVNGSGEKQFDENNHKDVYVKLKYKLGGRDFLGKFSPEEEVSTETKRTGSWVDNSLLIEGFGYWGRGPDAPPGTPDDDFAYYGVAVRGKWEDLELSGGYVRGSHDNPWQTTPAATDTDGNAWFAGAEYMIFPWLMGRAVYESLDWDKPSGATVGKGLSGSLDQSRILVGPVFAPRANIRVAVEGEVYTDHDAADANKLSDPHNIWLRLDFAL